MHSTVDFNLLVVLLTIGTQTVDFKSRKIAIFSGVQLLFSQGEESVEYWVRGQTVLYQNTKTVG